MDNCDDGTKKSDDGLKSVSTIVVSEVFAYAEILFSGILEVFSFYDTVSMSHIWRVLGRFEILK